MNALHSADMHSKEGWRLRPWLVAQLIGAVLTLTPQAFGQPLGQILWEFVTAWPGSDGTIYAEGITSAGGMQVHSAWVTTILYSPDGRQAFGYQYMGSGGYASAEVSLPFDQTDLGQYVAEANGGGT